jgi:hypothetical protein
MYDEGQMKPEEYDRKMMDYSLYETLQANEVWVASPVNFGLVDRKALLAKCSRSGSGEKERDETRYDAIVINGGLIGLDDDKVRAILEECVSALKADGDLMVFDFGKPSSKIVERWILRWNSAVDAQLHASRSLEAFVPREAELVEFDRHLFGAFYRLRMRRRSTHSTNYLGIF